LELGRHASRHEAEVVMARLVSEGRADASSLRVAHRPIPDDGNPLLPVIVFVIGIVVAALVAAVLVLTWH
jgi:hypothetical protein